MIHMRYEIEHFMKRANRLTVCFLIACTIPILLLSTPTAATADHSRRLQKSLQGMKTLFSKKNYEPSARQYHKTLDLDASIPEPRDFLTEPCFEFVDSAGSNSSINGFCLATPTFVHRYCEEVSAVRGTLRKYISAANALAGTVESDREDEGDELSEIHRLYLIRRYEDAFHELSETYETGTEIFLVAASFFTPLLPPLLLLMAVFSFGRTRRLSPFFCMTPRKEGEIFDTTKNIMFVFILFFLLPRFAFDPFAPNYVEKVVLSVHLHKSIYASYTGYFLAYAVSLVFVPIYYMRKSGISLSSLFVIDRALIRKIIVYVPLGLGLVVILTMPLFAILYFVMPSTFREQARPFAESLRTLPLFDRLFFALITPLMEEICHRGMVFLSLKRHFKTYWSILFSALFFVTCHYMRTAFSLVGIFMAGIVCAYLVHRTKSLWPPFLLHATLNSTSLMIARWSI